MLTPEAALEINRETQQFEQVARAALLPDCFRTSKSSLGTLEVHEKRLNRAGAHHDVVQFQITVGEALGVEFFN